jgi:hypothetical protein
VSASNLLLRSFVGSIRNLASRGGTGFSSCCIWVVLVFRLELALEVFVGRSYVVGQGKVAEAGAFLSAELKGLPGRRLSQRPKKMAFVKNRGYSLFDNRRLQYGRSERSRPGHRQSGPC